ncbi:MAG: enoyl-CoA hydratase-related protein [Mycobacteriaceae bacterium]
MSELVLSERRGPVAVLTLNRPERLNAWTNELENQYFDLLLHADDDPEVGAIVVTGAGRGFCAGADMDGLRRVSEATEDDLLRPRPRDLPMTVRKPLIGAVNGVAAGLGMVEALYCDVRFGSPSARFTSAFSRRGLIAEYGISWILPRLVGHSRAMDLLLSSRMVDAEEALRIGLVDHLVASRDVLDAAVEYANDLATHCSPTSMATIKTQLHRDADTSYAEAADRAEQLMFAAFQGPDVVEGVASFLEKRPPNFPPLPVRTRDVPL